MAVFSFQERYNRDGKTICPFCTNEGSVSDLKRLCAGTQVTQGPSICGAEPAQSKKQAEALDKRPAVT